MLCNAYICNAIICFAVDLSDVCFIIMLDLGAYK